MKIWEDTVYETDNSDVKVVVHRVYYRGEDYIKLKATLVNKNNGIVYETKGYKLYYKNIAHWKKVIDKI